MSSNKFLNLLNEKEVEYVVLVDPYSTNLTAADILINPTKVNTIKLGEAINEYERIESSDVRIDTVSNYLKITGPDISLNILTSTRKLSFEDAYTGAVDSNIQTVPCKIINLNKPILEI